FYTA
ncbi:3'-5' exonuclease/helicase, partial [Talaromyces pinophilus]